MNSQTLKCFAPEDIIVNVIPVLHGPVKAADVLMELRSPALDRFKTRLETLLELVAVAQRPFEDGRTERLIELLEKQSVAADAELAWHDSNVKAVTIKVDVGLAVELDLSRALTDRTSAFAAALDARDKVASEPLRATDARDRLAISRRQLEHEKRGLADLAGQLTIKAPVDGMFMASVGLGAFVKKGDECGVLHR